MRVAIATATTAETGKDPRPRPAEPGECRRQQGVEARLERVSGEQGRQRDTELRAGEVGRRDLERANGHPEVALAALRPDLQVVSVEVDERELGGDEESRPDGQHEARDEQQPLRH